MFGSMSQNIRNTSEWKTATVPLFLSTVRSRMEASRQQQDTSDSRSQLSTYSVEDTGRPNSDFEPLRPAVYQSPQAHQAPRRSEMSDLYGAGGVPPPHPQQMPSISDLESGVSHTHTHSNSSHSRSHSTSKPRSSHRPRRRIARTQLLKSHIRLKLRLTISFGLTLLVSSIIYLSLAATHVSTSTAFHVISILLLLVLTAIFSHSLIRWLMLKRDYRAHSERRIQRTQPPSFRGWDISWPRPLDNQPPPQPIPVYMSGDQHQHPMSREELSESHHEDGGGVTDPVMAMPPPIYGNFRDSVQINPSHISLHPLHPTPPSVHTPSYAASISAPLNPPPMLTHPPHINAHGHVLSYRPPSYGSEGGITQVLETRRRDVEGALKGMRAYPPTSSSKGLGRERRKGSGSGKAKVGRIKNGKVVGGAWVREKKGGGSSGSRR